MQPKVKRLIIGATAFAVAAGGLIVSNSPAQALPPGTAPNGSVTIAATNPLSTPLAMAPNPAPATCNGNGIAGYRWGAFISNTANDPATLTWTATGATAVGGTGFTSSLLSISGTFVDTLNPSSIGNITPIPSFNLAGFGAALVPGTYNIGFACALAGQTTNYWSTPITVTATSYSVGVAPAAPVLTTTSVTATSATVNFTHAPSTPATTGYTATVTPTLPSGPALAAISVPAGATSFTVPGLTTGTTYSVTLRATNPTGLSPVSNTLSFIPSAAAQPAILPLLTPGVGQVTITTPAVTIGGARTALPTSLGLAVSPAPTTGPATFTIPSVGGAGITQVVPGITPGTPYTFTLTVVYATPNSGPGGVVTGTSNNAQVVQQRITVVRPVGQLVLTQRCGVNGALPAVPAVDAFPGFPTALGAVAASASQVGTTPDITPNGVFPTGAGRLADAVTPDPQFNNYPFPSPATYPTECGVNLGTATIVNTGALAGQYYEANGFINEVTVADTRDTDLGWEVRGQMSDFVGTVASTNIIDGDYLGWNPVIQAGFTPTMTLAAGTPVLPGTGVTTGTGLGTGRRLAQASPNAGLGIAQMDARLRMLIPLSANNDTYTGILNFTVLPSGTGTTP